MESKFSKYFAVLQQIMVHSIYQSAKQHWMGFLGFVVNVGDILSEPFESIWCNQLGVKLAKFGSTGISSSFINDDASS